MTKLSKDAKYWFQSNISSISNLVSYMGTLLSQNRSIQAKACIFLYNGKNPVDEFNRRKPSHVKSATFKCLNSEEQLYLCHFILDDQEENKVWGYFFKHPDYSNVYAFLTLENMYALKIILNKYFKKFYPNLSRIFFLSRELEEILSSIETENNVEIYTKRFVVNRKYVEPTSEVKYKTHEISMKRAFLEAKENELWVKSLMYFARKPDNSVLFAGSVSREGILKFGEGRFELFFMILGKISHIMNRKIQTFSGRERTKEENYKVKPLAIDFEEDVFDSKERIQYMIDEVFSTLPRSSVSVFHFNPYLRLTFTDFKDGSSYDIWITSRSKLIIVPQLRATYASLMGLCSHIFQNFKEGILEDFQRGVVNVDKK